MVQSVVTSMYDRGQERVLEEYTRLSYEARDTVLEMSVALC